MTLNEAANSPVVLWITIIIAVLVAVAAAVPKVLGPLGEGVSGWLDSRRRMAVARDDADIAERDRMLGYLRGVADERQREIERRDALIAAHAIWDRERLTESVAAGHAPPPPPPLYPDLLDPR